MSLSFRKFLKKDLKESILIIQLTLGIKNAKKAKIDFLEGLSPKTKEYYYLDRFVACKEDLIMGIGGLYTLTTHPKTWAGICWFAVHPKYQRKGFGSKIVVEIERRARKKGNSHLFVWSVEEAIPFYTRFGFKKSKKQLIPKESNVLLVKKLN